jgi:16S rRNA (cytidine1402-2'-O)-methyltransferase
MNEAILYIVATPIGNLGDMVPRAVEVLQSVDLVAAEDTRHSGRLLQHFCIDTPLLAYHDHSDERRVEQIVNKLQEGKSIALISDAGTPLISDPGYRLVKCARDAGITVVPIPGACAMVAALSVAGLPSDRFVFEGFLPAREGARERQLESLKSESRTLVFYESPHRIVDSLASMQKIFGAERQALVARELTKTFETIKGGTLSELCEWVLADSNQQRGEFVVIVAGSDIKSPVDISPESLRVVQILSQELPPKQAAALAAKITGVKKRALYQGLQESKAKE